jgi:hypothetical protein
LFSFKATNSCSPSPCGVHGSCIEAVAPGGTIIAVCNCENQWTGKFCDVNMAGRYCFFSIIDLGIKPFIFLEGCSVGYCITGTCQLIGNAPYCSCPALYTGQRCETLIGAVTTTAAPGR